MWSSRETKSKTLILYVTAIVFKIDWLHACMHVVADWPQLKAGDLFGITTNDQ